MKNTGDFLILYDASPENLRRELRQMVLRHTENKMPTDTPLKAGSLADLRIPGLRGEKLCRKPKKTRHP